MTTALRALVVEDSEDDAVLVVNELRRGGYEPEWLRVETAHAMQSALHERQWDVVISDYSLPSFSGSAALELTKASGFDIPFLMVSGVVGEETAVAAMKAGAHDFFVKGHLGRLVAAIERELRDAAVRRKQREDAVALREMEVRFNAFMNNIPTPAWIKDEKFRYVYVNVPLSQQWGRTVDDLIGCTDFEVMPREIARNLRDHDTQVLESNQMLHALETMLDGAGQTAIFTVLKFPLLDAIGRRHVAGVALDITERVRDKEQLENANRRLQMLSSKVIEIQERERQHISRGLHDDIGQALTAVKINLDAMRARAVAGDGGEIDESVRIVSDVLQQVRSLSLDLRPPQLDDLGLAAAVRWYIDRKATVAGLKVRFRSDMLPDRLHPDIETACFRIAQEAMTNILRHSEASNVWVDMRRNGDQLHLSLRDDGRGFDVAAAHQRAAQGESSGLMNMQERASLVGGRVEITSRSAHGAVVDVFLPNLPRLAAAAPDPARAA